MVNTTTASAPDLQLRRGSALVDLPATHAAFLAQLGWQHEATLTLPGRPAAFATSDELAALLPEPAARLLASGPLYRHQALALAHSLAERHVVISTGTGSGKTRVFHLAAAAALAQEPNALILALYPGKALAREQAGKWQQALIDAGIATPGDRSVALLTGDQGDHKTRVQLFRDARVAVLTPDVLHAWLLGHLGDASLRRRLANLRLIVLDEAHTYAGVFGSNALWLFRRLQHALHHLRAPAPRWLAASATLAHPDDHLAALVGQDFTCVGSTDDTSPAHPRHLHFIRPATGTPFLPGLGAWLQHSARATDTRFAVFTQSRKKTETIARIGNRTSADTTQPDEACDAGLLALSPRIAPYRSGLSPSERTELQTRFASGDLRGLVCTSAFELGIDLPGLDLGFLAGLPESPASFWQRLGRFGRHGESHVFLIHDGNARTDAFFAAPYTLAQWQARDAALYPDNPVLLARHILCLAHEAEALGAEAISESLPFSPLFRTTYAAFQRGELTAALREAQSAQGSAQPPHYAFPLRTIDDTFTFKAAYGGTAPEGFVTRSQLLREAYPGAVYYHAGTSWRITGIHHRRRELTVARERAYSTEPTTIPSRFVPDLAQPAFADLRWTSGLRLLEATGRATSIVTGFSELRGSQTAPGGDYRQGAYGQQGPLCHAYDTTGILLFHPLISDPDVRADILGESLRQGLLLACPREAAELGAATGTLKATRRELAEGTRFVALYDTVPGSLRLTAALAEPEVLRQTLAHAALIAAEQLAGSSDPRDLATLAALQTLALAATTHGAPEPLPLDWPDSAPDLALQPGTTALYRKQQLPVIVRRVSTDLDGHLRYLIERTDDPAFHGEVAAEALTDLPDVSVWVPLADALAAA